MRRDQQYVDAVSQKIAGAKMVVMPGGSVLNNIAQSEAFNCIVLDFLDAINQPPKP